MPWPIDESSNNFVVICFEFADKFRFVLRKDVIDVFIKDFLLLLVNLTSGIHLDKFSF